MDNKICKCGHGENSHNQYNLVNGEKGRDFCLKCECLNYSPAESEFDRLKDQKDGILAKQLASIQQVARKEVIDYIEQRGDLHFEFPFGQITKTEWLAKKKEWGL